MNLLQIARTDVDQTAALRRHALGEAVSRLDRGESRPHEIEQPIVLDVAGGGDDDALRLVEPMEKTANGLGVEIRDVVAGAQDRAPQRSVAPEVVSGEVVDVFVRAVFDHADLLQDDRPFAFDFKRVEDRIEKDV